MSDERDLEEVAQAAEDSLAVAQRALSKVNDLERELDEVRESREELKEELTAVKLRLSEIDDERDVSDLTPDEKVGRVREYGYRKAVEGHGRAKLDYDAIKWEVFDGRVGDSTCYRMIRKAAGLSDEKTGSRIDGFTARDPSQDNYHLAIDAEAAKRSPAFSAGKKHESEGVR